MATNLLDHGVELTFDGAWGPGFRAKMVAAEDGTSVER
jgi:hypothetical protein